MHRFRSLGLACLLLAVPLTARGDKKADEEWKKINPPVPYKLWVGGHEYGSEEIRKIFAEKNAKKKWRPFYDMWFTLVSDREGAEILVNVKEKRFDSRPGYKTVYYTEGRLTIRGIVTDVAIRGDDTGGRLFSGPQDEFDLLNRIVRFMRNGHKEAVLAHTSSSAVAHAPSAPPKATATPAPPKGPLVEKDNETYGYWERFKPGSWVVLRFEGVLTSETKQTLKSISSSEIVLEVRRKGSGPQSEIVPRRVKVEAKKTKSWKEAEESVDISGKLLRCRTQTAGTMKSWYCPDIPGGFARMEWNGKDGKVVQRVLATSWAAKR
jgi:hypothetical protein